MRFSIDSICLWLKNGRRRTIEFRPGKINVITGKSGTGKTAILDIFDYCLASSKHTISESIINESAAWYGVRFHIGNKHITICRRSPIGSVVSDEYFLSTIGELPDKPSKNTNETAVKKLLQIEFGIDDRINTPYGGQSIRAGSQLSFRFFLLFCSLSEDIITSSTVFFDKQSQDRYREALPRVFDLAMGIDDAPNILARERRAALEIQLQKLQKRLRARSENASKSAPELEKLATRAAALGLAVEADTSDPVRALSSAIQEEILSKDKPISWRGKYQEISAAIYEIDRKIRNLDRFKSEYASYKKTLSETEDSLRPIDVLAESEPSLIRSSAFSPLLEALRDDFSRLKIAIRNRNPVDIQIAEILRGYEAERLRLRTELQALPIDQEAFKSDRERWMFIGEAKGKLEVFGNTPQVVDIDLEGEIKRIEGELEKIRVTDVEERRDLAIRNIEKNAQRLLNQVSSSLENYANYEAIFSYSDKRLRLRKPASMHIENVGSSSNHMFLHLINMLALQELAISNQSAFVPPLIIIDQPSRPYYGDESIQEQELSSSDTSKITSAMKMLNDFVAHMINHYSSEFQMIIFEHIPPAIWKGLDYVHLVEIFRDGNALIPSNGASE